MLFHCFCDFLENSGVNHVVHICSELVGCRGAIWDGGGSRAQMNWAGFFCCSMSEKDQQMASSGGESCK